jgi:hypothetical protein
MTYPQRQTFQGLDYKAGIIGILGHAILIRIDTRMADAKTSLRIELSWR